MKSELLGLLDGMSLSQPASEAVLRTAALELGVPLPEDYSEFMRVSDGAEGQVGSSYLVLWPVSKLVERNEAQAVDEFAPGLVLFGSDGGNEAYAFDLRSAKFSEVPIVRVPLAGMSLGDVVPIGPTFLGFLRVLKEAGV